MISMLSTGQHEVNAFGARMPMLLQHRRIVLLGVLLVTLSIWVGCIELFHAWQNETIFLMNGGLERASDANLPLDGQE